MFLMILIVPCNARRRYERGITNFIINLYGNPPGSGLDSKTFRESSTNGNEV